MMKQASHKISQCNLELWAYQIAAERNSQTDT